MASWVGCGCSCRRRIPAALFFASTRIKGSSADRPSYLIASPHFSSRRALLNGKSVWLRRIHGQLTLLHIVLPIHLFFFFFKASMAHFFSKAHQPMSKAPTTTPQSPYNARQNRPPIHPPPPVPPPSSTASLASLKPPAGTGDITIQPTPYPHSIASGYPTPHPHISIETVSTAHIPSLTRITGLLLPIRYPNSFYTAIITDPVVASLSRVAIYHDHPVAAAPASTSNPPGTNLTTSAGRNIGADKVIGGIRCRLEHLPQTASELLRTSQLRGNPAQEPTNLYIQTLHLLSPYRGNGVATSLLNSLLFDVSSGHDSKSKSSEGDGVGYQVSGLAKHYNIRFVTAHVHEANEEALEWYIARGFQVQEGVIENYYRRLRPTGARVVKLNLQWDHEEDGVIVSGSKDEKPDDQDNGEQGAYDGDDEDWEKVEAEDEVEQEDHGIQLFTGSMIFDGDGGSRKRKAGDEPQH